MPDRYGDGRALEVNCAADLSSLWCRLKGSSVVASLRMYIAIPWVKSTEILVKHVYQRFGPSILTVVHFISPFV